MSAIAKDIMDAAHRDGYAVGAYNMHNDETTQALLIAAEEADSPIFLQVGRAVIPHMGLKRAYEMTKRFADESDAAWVIHLDHGPFDEVLEAIKLGFTSIMYDGAHLPFEENIATTKRVVEMAHDFGILVEAELGRIPDASSEIRWEDFYTDPGEAERFVAETGVDLLAISAGVMHGVTEVAPQPLAIDLIAKIKDVTGIPLVLHGASGVPDDEVREAAKNGVHKFNADTDLRMAFRRGIEEVWAGGDAQLETALSKGREYMITETKHKMDVYGCAGRAGDAGRLASAGRTW